MTFVNWNRPRLSFVLLVALSCALVAACGGGGGDDGTPTPNNETPVPAVEIDQDNLKFNPSDVTITADGKVTFKNSESAIHTVTIDGKNESGTMERDETFEWSPGAPGVYKISCDFHPQMRATVTAK